jgi:excisionase family DNA binding protein
VPNAHNSHTVEVRSGTHNSPDAAIVPARDVTFVGSHDVPRPVPGEPSSLQKRALSVDEFCEMYGVERTTAYKLMGNGDLPSKKCGTRRLIPIEAAERWFANLPAANSKSVSMRGRRTKNAVAP